MSEQLWQACETNDLPALALALETHHVDERSPNEAYTPLMVAANRGHVEAVEYLITRGADINVQSDGGETPLMLGARADVAVVARLLAAGANPNQVSGGGNSALMEAAYPGNIAVVSMLLRAGANPNHTNQFQESALLVGSMSRGNVATIQALLDAGADPSHRDCDDVSAADLAKKHSNLPVYNLLTSRSGDVLHVGA